MFRVAKPYGRPYRVPVKGTLSEVNTGSPVMYLKHHMDSSIEAKFHVNLIDQLGRVFVQDGLRFLSIDQERFMSKFFEQAGEVTDRLNAHDSQPYKDLEDVFKQLDDFLGSYHGVNNGRYTR